MKTVIKGGLQKRSRQKNYLVPRPHYIRLDDVYFIVYPIFLPLNLSEERHGRHD